MRESIGMRKILQNGLFETEPTKIGIRKSILLLRQVDGNKDVVQTLELLGLFIDQSL